MTAIGIDTGGTFTDLVLRRGSSWIHLKIPSTPPDPSQAVLDGIDRLTGAPEANRRSPPVIHGSTVATNALLERKGARTALITTEGFADVLSIGRQARTHLYDLTAAKPTPLVPRTLVLETTGRAAPDGKVLSSPSKKEIAKLRAQILRLGVESLAIGTLHAYANPSAESRLNEDLSDLGIPISLSHEILSEFREYERLSTTVINAYVTPIMGRYLDRIAQTVGQDHLQIMLSSGGTTSAQAASHSPVHTVLSGPAAGVVAALHLAKEAGFPDIMTLDMGGTSTDVALAEGELPHTMEHEYDGLVVRAPALDIHTVGAGGGSIAEVDTGGALRVGPHSAGATPGPACYGNEGGGAITCTDAHVVLGRIHSHRFLGGAMTLRPERIRPGLARLTKKLKCNASTACLGILDVANSTMERALKVISLERGHDPRDFTLVCFGGAGGLHAADLASELRIQRVLVPRNPGLLSAIGLLLAAPAQFLSRTVFLSKEDLTSTRLRRLFGPLESKAKRRLVADGIATGSIRLKRSIDLRYKGQSFELEVPVPSNFARAADRFHALHHKRYGHCDPRCEIEGVTLRVQASATRRVPRFPRLEKGRRRPPRDAVVERAAVQFRQGRITTPFYRRDRLLATNQIDGPAVIHEYSSTTVVPPGFTMRVDDTGNLLLKETTRG